MKIVIFLGPTLPKDEAKAILPNALFLPPAGQSDLLSAMMTYKPDVIGLIDGVFSQTLSVWHKEILYALEQGIRVYGASSMGALRAAETDVYGMVGVGDIYEMYQRGDLTDDDEVALAHSAEEDGYRNISEPMVNLRATFRAALERGIITPAVHDVLVDSTKALYYPERLFPTIFRKAEQQGVEPAIIQALQRFVVDGYVNLKRLDAVKLLETLRDLPSDLPPLQTDFKFNRSHLFNALYDRDRMIKRPAGNVTLDSISSYVALNLPDFLNFNFKALNRSLALVLADTLEIEVTADDVKAETRRFRLRHDLKTKSGFDKWVAENDLTLQEFDELMREVALCRQLHRWLLSRLHLQGNVRLLLNELRLENRYTEWADKAAQQEAILDERYPLFLSTDHSDIPVESLLLDHLQSTSCFMDVNYQIWLDEAGFDNPAHLWMALLRAKLARDVINESHKESMESEDRKT